MAIDNRTAEERVASVVPLHALAGKLTGKRKIRGQPTTDDLVYHAEMARRRRAMVAEDPLVVATKSKVEAVDVLRIVQAQVAEEASNLKFFRIEAEKYGQDIGNLATRRVSALKEITRIELEIKELTGSTLDPHSESFQRTFKLFLETVRETASELFSPEQVDLLFNQLGTKLEGWEDKVEHLIRS